MLLDYTQKEQIQIDAISAKYKATLNKAIEEYQKAEEDLQTISENAKQGQQPLNDKEATIICEFERARDEYTRLSEEYEKERNALERRAEAREARYFTEHTEELTECLCFEIEAQIVSFGILKNHTDFGAVFQDNEEMRKRLIRTFKRYLNILQKHDAENYHRVISFMDSSIADKEEITQAYREKLEEIPADSPQSAKLWDKPYLLMLQNNATNDFNKVARLKSTRGTLETWDEQATYTQGNLTIYIPNYEGLLQNASIGKNGEISTTAKKLLDIACIIFTQNGHKSLIAVPLDEYMELCGLSDKKEARRQVNAALALLFDMSLSYDDSKNGRKSRNYMDMRIIDKKGIKNGIIYLNFASAFSEMLKECSVMPYYLNILKASKGREHRNSYYMARKIKEHIYMNFGKTNERKISVRTLLKAAPFLATEEEVRSSDRRFTDRITKPFISDLEEACTRLDISSEGYELHYAGGEKIPDKELEELPYEVFINAYVWFDMPPNYPDQTQRIEKKNAIAQAAQTTKKRHRIKKKK